MNTHLVEILEAEAINYQPLSKSNKVALLRRWCAAFPNLSQRARHGHFSSDLFVDKRADAFLGSQMGGELYLFPDDASGMPAVRCRVSAIPDLTDLLSDTYTKCDEIVVVDQAFTWSCVLVNHGAAGVGRYAGITPT